MPYFRELEARDLFSGVVFLTRGSEQLYEGAFGWASRTWKVRNTPDMRFDTASITKLFTAVASLQMIEQGRLAFNTSAVDYLGLKDTLISREVNVFHLLTHSSGIADDADEEAGESYEELWKTRPNYAVSEAVDFLPQFVHKPANFPPGQGCRYCNCGYILLGLCVEKASGMSYREYVNGNIFTRAGMSRSGFFRMDRANEEVAEGCDPLRDGAGQITGWKRNIYSYPPIGTPDGGAHVSAADLDRFMKAVRAGKLLSAELSSAFFTSQVAYRETEEGLFSWGYGLEFLKSRDGQVIWCEKGGSNAGVSGLVRYYPAQDITLVLLSNMENSERDPVRRIHAMIKDTEPR